MTDTTSPVGKQSKLTKGYLSLLGQSLGRYGVTVKQTSDGFWSITVQFDGQEETHAITTARGEKKVWRNVIGAISFVQQHCQSASEVFVEVGGWKLSRQ